MLIGLVFQRALQWTQFDLSPEGKDVRDCPSNNKRKEKSHLTEERFCRQWKMDDCACDTRGVIFAGPMHALPRGVNHGLAEGHQFDFLRFDVPMEIDMCGFVVDLE